MARLHQIAPDSTTGHVKDLLETVKAKLGLVPNMMRAMANSPAALEGYLGLTGALGKGTLPAGAREQIALAVAQVNGCDYCLAAHSALGRMAGLTADQIRDSRVGTAVDPKADALIRFARKVVDTRGHVDSADLEEVRKAGYDDGAIAEVVAHVALYALTDYSNIVAGTDVDFPAAPALVAEPAATA